MTNTEVGLTGVGIGLAIRKGMDSRVCTILGPTLVQPITVHAWTSTV